MSIQCSGVADPLHPDVVRELRDTYGHPTPLAYVPTGLYPMVVGGELCGVYIDPLGNASRYEQPTFLHRTP